MSGMCAILNYIETWAVINFFFLQGKAPDEIHAIPTETLACFLPGRAKDLSAPLVPSLTFDMRWVPIITLKVRNTWEGTSTSDYNNTKWGNEIMWDGNCWIAATVNRLVWHMLLWLAFHFVLKLAHWHVPIFMLDCHLVPRHLIPHYYWSSTLQGV